MMIRKLSVIFGSLGIIVIFAGLIFLLNTLKPETQRKEPVSQAPTVFVKEVTYAPLQLTVSAQGEVRPKQAITLTSQVGGRIVAVADNFADGGILQKGDTLVEIEPADYELAVTRAAAQVATARQALAVEKAESALARQDYEELIGQNGGDIPPSDLTLRLPQLAQAEASYLAAQADLKEAKLALSRTNVQAPFNGRVRTISANLGQIISPTTPLGEIFSTNIAEIRLPLTDEDLAKLDLPFAFNDQTQGPRVSLSAIAAGRLRRWEGRIVRVDAAIDATTRQIAAIVEVKDPYGTGADQGFPLAIGLYVDAEIDGPALDRALVVPRIAVHDENKVYVVDDQNRLRQTPVTVAATTSIGVVITGGVAPGQLVVVSRITANEGDEVQPLDPDNPSAIRGPAPTTPTVKALPSSSETGGSSGQAGAR
ncbi:MAG: efflux RND transporter periplasmic adaptor subunit [Pseudomonadota bacterium]